MPIHEIWFLVDGWDEWNFAYGSTSHEPVCLSGGIFLGCSVDVNVRLSHPELDVGSRRRSARSGGGSRPTTGERCD
jgi:hypothetical protein